MTLKEILEAIDTCADEGVSLTMADLLPEAQAILREAYPDPDDLPIPDITESTKPVK